jgi:hypothetical protein
MKHLKEFENNTFRPIPENKNEIVIYYKIVTDSMVGFDIALEKLNILTDFYKNIIWSDETEVEYYIERKIKINGFLYLSVDYYLYVFEIYEKSPMNYQLMQIRNENDLDIDIEIIDGGVVSVDEYEIKAKNYNL